MGYPIGRLHPRRGCKRLKGQSDDSIRLGGQVRVGLRVGHWHGRDRHGGRGRMRDEYVRHRRVLDHGCLPKSSGPLGDQHGKYLGGHLRTFSQRTKPPEKRKLMTSTPSAKTATAARVTGFLALLAAGAALLVLFAAAAHPALGNSSHNAEHAIGMHRPACASNTLACARTTRPTRPPVTRPPGGGWPLRPNAARAQQLADRAGNAAGESQDRWYRPRPRRSLHARSKQSGARPAALTRQFDKTLATLTGS
jgi:hypothetical protein